MARTLFYYAAGIALLYSALLHLTNPHAFLIAVLRYEIVNTAIAIVIAMVLPAFQLVVAVGLFLNLWRQAALVLASLLFALFSLAQWSALFFDLQIPCGCFGNSINSITNLSASIVTLFAVGLAVISYQEVAASHQSSGARMIV